MKQDIPKILNAKEMASYLNISLAYAYNLLNSQNFPTLHIGNRKMVTEEDLLLWIKQNTNK